MKVTAQYAEAHLPQLLSAASRGEEVEIDSPGQPLLLLVTSRAGQKRRDTSRGGLLNAAKGQIQFADDWDSPETNREIEESFENSILFPHPPQ